MNKDRPGEEASTLSNESVEAVQEEVNESTIEKSIDESLRTPEPTRSSKKKRKREGNFEEELESDVDYRDRTEMEVDYDEVDNDKPSTSQQTQRSKRVARSGKNLNIRLTRVMPEIQQAYMGLINNFKENNYKGYIRAWHECVIQCKGHLAHREFWKKKEKLHNELKAHQKKWRANEEKRLQKLGQRSETNAFDPTFWYVYRCKTCLRLNHPCCDPALLRGMHTKTSRTQLLRSYQCPTLGAMC